MSAAFVVKKQFSDKGAEALAFLHSREDNTLADVHEYIRRQVHGLPLRKGGLLHRRTWTILNKLPRWLGKTAVEVHHVAG